VAYSEALRVHQIQTKSTMKPLSETYKEQGIAFTFPIEIEDANGNATYYEDSDGVWHKAEYDSNGNQTYFESSDGHKRGSPK
jgi:hypothetical protein